MDSHVQLAAVSGCEVDVHAVIVDGRFVGMLKNLGNSVIWKPSYLRCSFQMTASEFFGMIRRAA